MFTVEFLLSFQSRSNRRLQCFQSVSIFIYRSSNFKLTIFDFAGDRAAGFQVPSPRPRQGAEVAQTHTPIHWPPQPLPFMSNPLLMNGCWYFGARVAYKWPRSVVCRISVAAPTKIHQCNSVAMPHRIFQNAKVCGWRRGFMWMRWWIVPTSCFASFTLILTLTLILGFENPSFITCRRLLITSQHIF